MADCYDFDDFQLLDDFEALLDDLKWPAIVTEETGDHQPCAIISSEESSVVEDQKISESTVVKYKPKKSEAAKRVAKVTCTDMVVTKRNQSTEAPRLKWNVFPSFDRSDSTLYFASSFARLVNNGDEQGLNKLVTTHCAKDTIVTLRHETDELHSFRVPVAIYLELVNTVNVLHPDALCCMHSTQVVGNKIHAVLYGKSTDSVEMYDYRSSMVDPKFTGYFVGNRKELFIRNLGLHELEESKRTAIYKLLDLNVDFEVYSKVDITLTLHDRTKKIIDFSYLSTTTSICYEGIHYPTV